MKKQKPKKINWKNRCIILAKKIVKKRDKKCQITGIEKKGLHCSHVYPAKEFPWMAAEPLNMKLLDFPNHFFWWHKNPLDAAEWFINTFPDRYLILKKMSQCPREIDWEKKYYKLKNEFDKIKI